MEKPEPKREEAAKAREGNSLTWLHATPVIWAASTYFGEGLPYSIVHQVIGQQYLTAANYSAEIVGLASLLHAPWLVKFLWSPLVERRASTKQWMVGAQLALALLCVVMGTLMSKAAAFTWLLVVLVAMAFTAATNDIAIDGYYLRSLDSKRQTAFSGVRISAFRAAMLLGSGPIVSFAGLYGFGPAMFVLAGILASLAILHAVVLKRDERGSRDENAPSVEARPPNPAPVKTGEAIRAFFGQPLIAPSMLLLLTYRAGDALLFAMNAKFLASLGLDTTLRGVVNGTFGTAASIAGSLAGGFMIARLSFKRIFVPITLIQSGALLFYHGLAHADVHVYWSDHVTIAGVDVPALTLIGATVIAEQFIAGVGTAAFTSFILRLCQGTWKTMHFAFASSLMSVAATVAGTVSGYVFSSVGAESFFLVAFFASLPGVAASFVVRKK